MRIKNSGKKFGFTLAEVLVVITIIGIIAMETIPTLVQNIRDSELKAAWKIGYSTEAQAFKTLVEDYNGSVKGVLTYSAVMDIYKKYFIATKVCNGSSGCWHSIDDWYNLDGVKPDWSYDYAMILNNGFLMGFHISDSNCNDITRGTIRSKGRCGSIYVDVNGWKKPNTVGKDIYCMHMQDDLLVPYGIQGDNYDPSVNCTPTGSGCGCSSKYLLNN